MALRIMSYNIWMGGEERLPHIAQVIQQQQPDVVALLEANNLDNAEQLATQLNMQLIFGESNGHFHVAWLSRLPVLHMENHKLPVLRKTLLEIDVAWDNITLPLFATHLRAGRWEDDEHYRVSELRAILEVLARFRERPHALMGDLNSIHPQDQTGKHIVIPTNKPIPTEEEEQRLPRLAIPELLNAGYVDCYRKLHPDEQSYTFKLPQPWLRLDYLFATPSLAEHLQRCEVVTSAEARIASDHLPIWAEFDD